MNWIGRALRAAMATTVSVSLAGCGAGTAIEHTIVGNDAPKLGVPVDVTGFPGAVVADEPQAVRIGQHILFNNGSAADAAVAMGFALAVTLPSRAGLGGGGACLVYTAGNGDERHAPEAVLFAPLAPAARAGDRPASVPMLALGLTALHEKFGVLPMAQDIVPAEELARFGATVSPALAADFAVVDGALLADPAAAAAFSQGGAPLNAGDLMIQHDLSATLARLRVAGARDLYDGALAHEFATASAQAGGPVTTGDLSRAAAIETPPLIIGTRHNEVGFMPNDAGVAAGAVFERLHKAPDDLSGMQLRAFGAAAAAREGMSADRILSGGGGTAPSFGALPASTSYVVLDRAGNAVACDLTMNNLFGTGRVAPGTGILLSESPAVAPLPLLAAAIAWGKSEHAFRAAVAASGQEAASAAVGYGMFRALNAPVAMPGTVPSPGRLNAIACNHYLPGDAASCTWATDPRGAGLAVSTD